MPPFKPYQMCMCGGVYRSECVILLLATSCLSKATRFGIECSENNLRNKSAGTSY